MDYLAETRNRYATPAAYIEGVYRVSLKYREHSGKLTMKHTQAQTDRIMGEWSLCVMRQPLVLRDRNSGFDLQRFRKYDGLMISHSGHLMDPGTQAVVWRNPGKPQPTCEKILEGVRATGRTFNAAGRPRPEHADDAPRAKLFG